MSNACLIVFTWNVKKLLYDVDFLSRVLYEYVIQFIIHALVSMMSFPITYSWFQNILKLIDYIQPITSGFTENIPVTYPSGTLK